MVDAEYGAKATIHDGTVTDNQIQVCLNDGRYLWLQLNCIRKDSGGEQEEDQDQDQQEQEQEQEHDASCARTMQAIETQMAQYEAEEQAQKGKMQDSKNGPTIPPQDSKKGASFPPWAVGVLVLAILLSLIMTGFTPFSSLKKL
jgi:hypothetical protein